MQKAWLRNSCGIGSRSSFSENRDGGYRDGRTPRTPSRTQERGGGRVLRQLAETGASGHGSNPIRAMVRADPRQAGHELWVGDAAAIRAAIVRKQKTDARDARHILELLLENAFHEFGFLLPELTSLCEKWGSVPLASYPIRKPRFRRVQASKLFPNRSQPLLRGADYSFSVLQAR